MMVVVVPTLPVCDIFTVFFANSYVVNAVFWHLHLLYLLQASNRYFIVRTKLGLHIL